MATYERREVTARRVEFHVPTREPWGACWSDVQQAVYVAMTEMRKEGLLPETAVPADDAIRIHGTDESIVVVYERSAMQTPPPQSTTMATGAAT